MARAVQVGRVGRVVSPGVGRASAVRYLPVAEHGLIGNLHLRTTWACTRRKSGRRAAARQFPQAFTHLALISAAYNLDRQLG
jgi:hypothetical protein